MNNCVSRRCACTEQIFRSNTSLELLHIKKETAVLSTYVVNSAMWLCINVPLPACSTKICRHKSTASSVQSVMRQFALQHSFSPRNDNLYAFVWFEFVSASARMTQLSSSSSSSLPILEILILVMVTRYQQCAIYFSRCGSSSEILWDVTLYRWLRGFRRFERP